MKKYTEIFRMGWKYLCGRFNDDTDRFLLSIFGVIVYIAIVVTMIDDNDLNRNAAFAVGVITKVNMSGRGGGKFYKFYVDGVKYTGIAAIGGGGSTKIRAGDSIIVEYDRTNPENSAIYIYFQYRLDRSKLPDTVYYRQLIDNQRKPLN